MSCKNCKPKNPCWVHTEYERQCEDCGAAYVGTRQNLGCASCAVKRIDERNRQKLARRSPKGYIETKRAPKDVVCKRCGVTFIGVNCAKFCHDCKVKNYIEKMAAARVSLAVYKPELDVPPKKRGMPGSKLPPACQFCEYCVKNDAYDSGMECSVSGYLRCQPWAPNAKPLKEKKNV